VSLSNGLLPRSQFLFSRWLAAARIALLWGGLMAAFGGCKSNREVHVRVSIPGPDSLDLPAAGVGVVALPYDRDSVLASLEAKADRPKPHTAELDSLFARFRGPFTRYTTTVYTTTRLEDTLGRIQRQLDTTPQKSADYGPLQERLASVSASLATNRERSERARVDLSRARTDFVGRSESLRTAVRLWEDSTYRGYDSIVNNLAKTRGREPATDTTGATGWARLSLAPGSWWIYARAWDTSDPNSEWYWNVPVNGDTVLLSSRTGRRQPRY
jgi:hypothetical protein